MASRHRAILIGLLLAAGWALLWILQGGHADLSRDGAETDLAASGAAALADASPAAADIARADAELLEHTPAAADALEVLAGPINRDLDLHGIVLGPDGSPYAGAEVALILPARQGEGGLDLTMSRALTILARTQTAADGSFRFSVEPGRRYDLDASARGLIAPLLRNCQSGERAVLRLSLAAALRGRVFQSDGVTPVAQAWLRLFRMGGIGRSLDTVSDATGAFLIGGLDPGEWSLEVEAAGWPEQNWQTFPILPGEVLERDVLLVEGVLLRGLVVDAVTRAPIAGAEISSSWVFSATVRSGTDGSFALPMLPPGAWAWEYHARAPGYGRRSWEREGALPDQPLIIELSAGRRLSGRITGGGQPIVGAYVAAVTSVSGDAGQQIDWQAVRSGRDGAFLIEDLRPDCAHALQVRHPGFGAVIYELPPDEMLLPELDLGTIDLAPAATIAGRAVDEDGAPLAGLQLRLSGTNQDRGRWSPERIQDLSYYVDRVAARTDDLGRFSFTDLAAGTFTLRGIRQSLEVGSPVMLTLAPGEQKSGVELVIAGGMKIKGKVFNPDGLPVAGVRIFGFSATTRDLPALQPTDADGAFVLPGLQAGLYRIEFHPPRNWSDPQQPGALFDLSLDDVAAGTENLEVRLPWLSSIRGRVLHEDGAPAQAFVSSPGLGQWSYYSTATSPDGSFTLWVPAGAILELTAQARRDSGIPGVHIVGGDAPQEVHLPGVAAGAMDLILRLPRVP